MGGAQNVADEFGDTHRDVSTDVDRNRISMSRLNSILDKNNNKMRAANKVGELFEDGLGSLSVNLGAFTVALRNFLTQVPLLLAALGSLGAAAVGVAGAFVTAGTAIAGAMGAGALAMAQDIKEEHQEIKKTGEALQVMFAGVKDMLVDALEPLTERDEVTGIFEQIIEGTGEFINMFADMLAQLAPQIDELVDDLGQRLEEPLEEFTEAFSFMFLNLRDEFADMTVGIVDALSGLMQFTTRFADGITDDTRLLDQFIATLKQMAELGATIFDGLSPVFETFSGVLESVAAAINSMNQEFVAAAVTFLIGMKAVSGLSGVIGSILTLIPNVANAFVSADGSLKSLTSSFGRFIQQHPSIFSGFQSLGSAASDLGEDFLLMRMKAQLTEETFEDLENRLESSDIDAEKLDGSFEDLAEELKDIIRGAIASADSMDALEESLEEVIDEADLSEEEVEELTREMFELAAATEAVEESADDFDSSFAPDRRDIGTGGAPTFVPTAARRNADEAGGVFARLKSKLTGIAPAALSVASSLKALAGPLALLIALIGGVLVGIIGNFDEVVSSTKSTLETLGNALSFIGGILLDFFIDVWNALADILVGVKRAFMPILDMLGLTGDGANSAGESLRGLGKALGLIIDLIGGTLRVFGKMIKHLGTFIGFAIKIGEIMFRIASPIFMVKNLLEDLGLQIDQFMDPGATSTVFGPLVGGILNLNEALNLLPDSIRDAIIPADGLLSDFFSGIAEGINNIIETLDLDMEPIDTDQFGESDLQVSEEEVTEQTREFEQSLNAEQPNEINFNEDNSTNIDQTVNADPEDQAQLSRVVSDAIAEANSFERRRQGGQ